ncbi:MAG TPA: hypothetical protein VGB67_15215, partial [Fibrella sp.]
PFFHLKLCQRQPYVEQSSSYGALQASDDEFREVCRNFRILSTWGSIHIPCCTTGGAGSENYAKQRVA